MQFDVLVVDDSHSMQSALAALFETIPRVEVAAVVGTEMAAIEWVLENQEGWCLATVDLMLQEGSGFNIISRLKAQPGAGRIVVLSDFVTDAVARRCKDLGADAVFKKTDAKAFVAYVSDLASDLDSCPVCQLRAASQAG